MSGDKGKFLTLFSSLIVDVVVVVVCTVLNFILGKNRPNTLIFPYICPYHIYWCVPILRLTFDRCSKINHQKKKKKNVSFQLLTGQRNNNQIPYIVSFISSSLFHRGIHIQWLFFFFFFFLTSYDFENNDWIFNRV